jgi:UDP-N-acetylmuramyl pentapeptide phosphotransferase/UDP-N-acetylglucosamine-1-phosphate transferase
MNINLIIFLSIIYLFGINYILRKFDISLDKTSKNEKHKLLLRKDNSTPLSGTFYFLPIILILFHELDIEVLFTCTLFFVLGSLSDLKILSTYKFRLFFQIIFLMAFNTIAHDITIYIRFDFFDYLMSNNFFRIIICTFFFMVLINGYNLIDGTNSLCSLNFLISCVFTYLVINKIQIYFLNYELSVLIIILTIFFIFNFLGLNFLGDGAAYGVSFFLGYIFVKISLLDQSISPYFIANIFWYPAFENLFSILRRRSTGMNNYLPDNNHLHHLIYKYFKKLNFIKKNFLLSSFVGLSINSVLIMNYSIGYFFISNTILQVILIRVIHCLHFLFHRQFFLNV